MQNSTETKEEKKITSLFYKKLRNTEGFERVEEALEVFGEMRPNTVNRMCVLSDFNELRKSMSERSAAKKVIDGLILIAGGHPNV